MKGRFSNRRILLVAGALMLAARLSAIVPATVRIAVEKKRIVTGKPPALIFLPVTSSAFAAAGFTPLADYATRTLYDGPAAAADSLRASLLQTGYRSNVASDLDRAVFHEFQIDPDTGTISPAPGVAYAPTGTDGLYFLVLRAYPLDTWLDDLERRNIRRLTELPPAAYVVRCARTTAVALAAAPYVRGVFPLPPSLKAIGFDMPAGNSSPYRRVVIKATVETPVESLRPFLTSVALNGVVFESATGHTTRYEAFLTEIDAQTATQFETVYEVVAAGSPLPSSERQGQLLAQVGQEATLPGANTDYNAFLISRGIQSSANTFDNTRVGIIDTGFDTGILDYSSIHPDFRFTYGGQQITTVIEQQVVSWPFYEDRDYHGTLVTSIITGYPGALPTRAEPADGQNSNNYRYGLGITPTVRCIPVKIFQCNVPPTDPYSPDHEIMTLAEQHGANVINMSFNDPVKDGGCGYTQGSQDTDNRTRVDKVLAVVAAGNLPEGCTGNYVRGPATAKNALAVGSTDNFTLNYGDVGTLNVCAWDSFSPSRNPPVSQNATRIPDYSAKGYPTAGGSTTVVKPDLVAPSTRVTGPASRGATGCSAGNLCNASVASPDGVIYGMWDGTSFAAPVVSGAAAVVRKWHKNLLGGDPSPAMTKAILINGARDIAGTTVRTQTYGQGPTVGHIPDPYQGWGMVSFERLLGGLGGYYFYDQGLALLPSVAGLWQKYLYAVNGGRDTRVTLVWTDSPGGVRTPTAPADSIAPYPATNNLDLTVTSAAGTTTWYGNQLDQQGTGFSIANPNPPRPDGVNNVEQVIIPAGTFSSGDGLIVSVAAVNVPFGSQDFAVFIDNATEPGTTLTSMTPCRLVDTRNPVGPFGGPALSANATRTFTAWGNCGIPVSAKSVVLNATVTQTGADGTVRLFPGGIQPPVAGVVYYSAGQTRADNSIVALGGSGTIAARADQAAFTTTHLIIDVVGYYQ